MYLGIKTSEDMEFEEFFYYMAQADIIRELRIQDLEIGIKKALYSEE